MEHKPLIVTGRIVENNGKFLLIQIAKYKGADGLKWTIPAGRWDRNESILDGAKREFKEETGYDFKPTAILGLYSRQRVWPDTIHNTIRIIYKGKISGEQGEIEHEVVDTKWFSSEEIFNMNDHTIRFPEIKVMIKDYLADQELPLETIKHII